MVPHDLNPKWPTVRIPLQNLTMDHSAARCQLLFEVWDKHKHSHTGPAHSIEVVRCFFFDNLDRWHLAARIFGGEHRGLDSDLLGLALTSKRAGDAGPVFVAGDRLSRELVRSIWPSLEVAGGACFIWSFALKHGSGVVPKFYDRVPTFFSSQ